METIKIVSTHKESQGDFVIINLSDFNPKIHKKYENTVDKQHENTVGKNK